MANQEQLDLLLNQGVDAWNAWRQANPSITPDLSEANLTHADLHGANLSSANLSSSNLTNSNLSDAYLPNANLIGAYLPNANLNGANLIGTNLTGANLTGAGGPMTAPLNGTYKNPTTEETLVITHADASTGTFAGTLSGYIDGTLVQLTITSGGYHVFNNVGSATNISLTAWQRSTDSQLEVRENWVGTADASNFQQLEMIGIRLILKNVQGDRILSRLNGSFISEANPTRANLTGANFTGANLSGVNFSYFNLPEANLRDANLRDANFRETDCRAADFTGADLTGIDLTGADLTWAKGL